MAFRFCPVDLSGFWTPLVKFGQCNLTIFFLKNRFVINNQHFRIASQLDLSLVYLIDSNKKTNAKQP